MTRSSIVGTRRMPRSFYVLKIPPATVVPEPATLSLFALGLAGVGFMRRRKAIVL